MCKAIRRGVTMSKDIQYGTPDRIGNDVFGGGDAFKVQSQHERFLKKIENLPEDQQVKEYVNVINYLMANKSDYWFESAHLVYEIFKDREPDKPLYKKIEPTLTKKDFCDKYFKLSYKTIREYLKIVRETEKYKLSEELIRELGFNKTNNIIKYGNACALKNIDESMIKEFLDKQKSQKSYLTIVKRYINKLSDEEKKEIRKYIDGSA